MGINCDIKIQNSASLEVKQNPNDQKPGKLNHHVVKPISAAHNNGLGKLLTIMIGIVALPAIALATVAAGAVVTAVALSPIALIAGGIYLACTGGAPLAVAGLIGGGLTLSICGGGVLVVGLSRRS